MILKYFRARDWAMLACAISLIVCSVYFELLIPEYMSEITYLLQQGETPDVVADYGVEMILCACTALVLSMTASILAARVASSLCWILREKQFARIEEWSRQDIDSFSVASLITRSTNDTYHIQLLVARVITNLTRAPVMAVWAIFKITSSAFEWTLTTVIAMLILLSVMVWLMMKGVPYIRKMQWFVDAVNGETKEELEGMRTIRAYNAEERQNKAFDEASDALLGNAVSAVKVMTPMKPLASSMMSFLTLAIYWVGAAIIMGAEGDNTYQMQLFSDMIVFTSYATIVLSAVMLASGIAREVPDLIVSAHRVEEVIEHDSPIVDGPLSAESADAPGEVVFDHVSFEYPGTGHEILHDVSFSVGRGETLAIIGPTASGKSTLVNLMARMYDATSGTVSVGGRDVREYEIDELTGMLGYVPQTAIIFTGTMLENICYGASEGKTEEDALRAVSIAQLDDLVAKMPDGIHSDVSQHGWNLSGGQKQRLAIARAVCKDPPIYIFDDTFSALDSRTDRNLREALARETGDATKIIVAQRVGTIMDADRIVVLDHGSVVGSGRHEELMQTCGLYREIAESQLEAQRWRRRSRRAC